MQNLKTDHLLKLKSSRLNILFWVLSFVEMLTLGHSQLLAADSRCVDIFISRQQNRFHSSPNSDEQTFFARRVMIRDYTVTEMDLEKLAQSIGKNSPPMAEYKMVHYPFLGEAVNRFHWQQFRDHGVRQQDPERSRFAHLKSPPAVIPGSNRNEQRVHTAHLLFNQFLFYLSRLEQPLSKIPEEIGSLVHKMAEKRFFSPSLTFLDGPEFEKLATFHQLKSDRWMIIVAENSETNRIYIDQSKINSAKLNDSEFLFKLVGLIAHEYGHLVGTPDDTGHSLDKVGIYFAELIKNNTQIESVALGDKRVGRIYTIRTANSTFNGHSKLPEFGGRILLDDGVAFNDLTPILGQVLGVPDLTPQLNSAEVFLLKFWSFKSLGVRHWTTYDQGKWILSFNVAASVLRQKVVEFGFHRDPQRGNYHPELDMNAATSKDDVSVRFQIAFDAQNPRSPPLFVDALDARVTAFQAQGGKGTNFFSVGETLNPQYDLKLTMAPQFQKLRSKSGQRDLAFKFVMKVPQSEVNLISDLVQSKILVAPILSPTKSDIYGELSLWGLGPKSQQIMETRVDTKFVYIIFKYLYDIPADLPAMTLFAHSFHVLKVGQQGNQEIVGFLNSGNLEQDVDLNQEGIVDVEGTDSKSLPYFGKRVHPLGESIDFQIKNPGGFNLILLESVLKYRDGEGHEYQQFYKIEVFRDGKITSSGKEFGAEILKASQDGQSLILRIKRPESFPTDYAWLKSYQVSKVIVIGTTSRRLSYPVNFDLLP